MTERDVNLTELLAMKNINIDGKPSCNSATRSTTPPTGEWVIGESVKDWLKWRMMVNQYSFEKLQELTGLSRFTLDKLKKSDEYYISTPITEEKLSKVLGNYGYPSPLQMLLRQTDTDPEKFEGIVKVNQRIIKYIIELEQKKISILRKDIPWLEIHIVRKWLCELRKSFELICESLSKKYKCSINTSSIRIALVDGASRLARHLNIHDENYLNSIKTDIETLSLNKVEFISKDIFSQNIKHSTMMALLELDEANSEVKDWDLSDSAIIKNIDNLIDLYYEFESSLRNRTQEDFLVQYEKCGYSDVKCELCLPELETFTEPRILYSENDDIVRGDIPTSLDNVNFFYNDTQKPSKLIFIGNHFEKRFGAIQPFASKTFNVGMAVCQSCAEKYMDIFSLPFSTIVRKIRKVWGLEQRDIAVELGVNQGIVSKIENEKIRFIEPNLMLKIFGLYLFGTLDKNRLSCGLEKNLISKLRMSGFEDRNLYFNKKLKVKAGRFIGEDRGAGPLIEISCDLFVTNDSETVKIACFNFCRRVREVYFCLAISKSLGATHTVINGDICLDIRFGAVHPCELPFNMSIIGVRSIIDRRKYRELDKAILNTHIRDCDINNLAMSSLSSENALALSQPAFEASIILENEDYLEYELSWDVLSDDDSRLFNSDRLSDFFSNNSRRNYFRLSSELCRDINEWSLENLLIPKGYNNNLPYMHDLACNFQNEIVKSIENSKKTIEEISDIYSVCKEVIEMWIKYQ